MTEITFSWEIKKLKVDPNYSGSKDFIVSVEYDLIATDGTYTAIDHSIANLPSPESQEDLDANFTSFESLTEEIIISWIETNCFGPGGLDKIKQCLIDDINFKRNYPTTTEITLENNESRTVLTQPMATVEKTL